MKCDSLSTAHPVSEGARARERGEVSDREREMKNMR